MTMTKSTTGAAFSALKSAALDFISRKSTKTHVMAFCLGILFCIVSFRIHPPVIPGEVQTAATEPVMFGAESMAADIDTDAECVARVLYGIRGYDLSENAKRAVIEVIMNRTADTAREFRNFNSIEAVCEQPSQWQGYSSDGQYLREDYELALEVLNSTDRARTIPADCYFLLVQQGEVTVRTEYEGGSTWKVR